MWGRAWLQGCCTRGLRREIQMKDCALSHKPKTFLDSVREKKWVWRKKKKEIKKIFAKFPFQGLTSHVVWNKNRAYASWWWINLRCCSLSQRIQRHRIIEYPEWDDTHRDHQSSTPSPAITAEGESDIEPDLGTGHMTSPYPGKWYLAEQDTSGRTFLQQADSHFDSKIEIIYSVTAVDNAGAISLPLLW